MDVGTPVKINTKAKLFPCFDSSLLKLLSGRLRGFQPSLLNFFSSGQFLFLFCLSHPVFVIALVLLITRLVQAFCPYSRYFRKNENQDVEGTTATIRRARWIAG
jgi:hypothetical protein